jgi:hypothetical protein
MIPSNDLFDLIKSLTKSEKRYFRLFTARNGRGETNKYERLFALIERQDVYDEEEIRRALAGDPMERHLPSAKHYLHNAIMRALHSYHIERSVPAQVSILIHQAEILYRKKLYTQFAKLVARAKELSTRNELWHLTLDVIWLEYSLLVLGDSFGGIEKRVDALMTELAETLELLGGQYRFEMIQARLFTYVATHEKPRTPREHEAMRGILGETFEREDRIAITPMAKVYHNMNHAVYRQATGDLAGALDAYMRVLAVIDANGPMQNGTFLNPVLNNICLAAIALGDAPAFFAHHERLMRTVKKDPEQEGYKSYVAALHLMVTWHAATGEFERGVEAYGEVERAMEQFDGKLRTGFDEMIVFGGFRIHFGAGHHARAIDFLNTILERPGAAISTAGFACAKLFMLIAHLELGNDELLEYLIPSTARALRSREMMFGVEEMLLRFLRRTLRASSECERRQLASELLREIESLANDPFEKPMLEWIDLPAWIDSRATGRSYAAIVRESYMAKACLTDCSTQPSLC